MTIVDFAYKLDSNLGHSLMGAKVNERVERLDYVLKNKDRIYLYNGLNFSNINEECANTSLVRKKIKER